MGPVPSRGESLEIDYSGVRAGFRDLNFRYLLHPLVAASFILVSPLLAGFNVGFEVDALLIEVSGALPAVLLAFLGSRLIAGGVRVRVGRIFVVLGALFAALAFGTLVATILNPARIPSGGVIPGEPDFSPSVLAATTLAISLQHLFVWLLAMVVVGGTVDYRTSKAFVRYTREPSAPSPAKASTLEELRALQTDTINRIDGSLAAIERELGMPATDSTELANQVLALRQEVISPALNQLAHAADSAAASPNTARDIAIPRIPWRWRGTYFSGAVGALLIGAVGLLTVAPDAIRAIGPLVQLPLIMVAFFVSVPASVILLLTAALTPFLQPNEGVPENLGLFAIVIALVAVSFIQRFNQVRRVRVLETASVQRALAALAAVQERHQIDAAKKRVNQVLHGSIQATLLAVELGLRQTGRVGVAKATAGLIAVREALEGLQGEAEADLNFAQALDAVVSTWSAGIAVHVDIAPSAAEVLEKDAVSASAVLEVITEGTSNAVKHSGAREVEVNVSHEAPLLRVRVSHPVAQAAPESAPGGNGIGMRHLAELTTSLRLSSESGVTSLSAEVPYTLANEKKAA